MKEDQLTMVRLYLRSPKDSEGWAEVSSVVWPLLSDLPSELFDIEGDKETGGRIRANSKGLDVIPYLT